MVSSIPSDCHAAAKAQSYKVNTPENECVGRTGLLGGLGTGVGRGLFGARKLLFHLLVEPFL
jgi:hypothetical protein